MKKNKFFKKPIISIFAILMAFFLGTISIPQVNAQNAQETCPDGGEWTKVDSNDTSLYPVDGATEYCFKAGSDNSEGCEGGIFNSWPLPGGACGLSHWSYKIPEVCQETVTCGSCYAVETTLTGDCGDVVCAANAPAEESCPTECGLGSSTVLDGLCGQKDCAPTEQCGNECEEVATCPTQCDYAGGQVQGECGIIDCSPTQACNNNPTCDDPDATNTGSEENCEYPTDGKKSSMGKSGPACDSSNIHVTYDAKEDDQGKENIEITFNYNGEEKKVKTNSDGRASVDYGYKGEYSITAKGSDGYPDQAVHIEKFNQDECETPGEEEPGRGGQVLGVTTAPPDNGKVLGTTSILSATGTFHQNMMILVRMALGFGTGIFIAQYSKKAEEIA